MKKNILKLTGVQELDKKEQVSIKGGTNERRACGFHPLTGEACWQNKLVYPPGESGPIWGPCKTITGLACFAP